MSSTQKDPTRTDPSVLLSYSSPSLPPGLGTTLAQGWNCEEDVVAILTRVLCVCREREVAELPGEVPVSPLQVLQLGAWGWDEVSVLQGLILLGLGLLGRPRAQGASAAEEVPPLKVSLSWVATVP